MKFIRKNLTTILLIIIFTAGLSLLLYPTVSDWVNSMYASRAVVSYEDTVNRMSPEEYDQMIEGAKEYNSLLSKETYRFNPSDALHKKYEETLNITEDGMMGILKIPSLRVNLPIYHGTDDSVLNTALGHIEGSSLPIGGQGTHSVISGHRGLPSAKLLTDLDDLEEGDYFMIQSLDNLMTYQVDQISIVLPTDYSKLEIEDGKDFVTLMTCTPYGINSHRLMVRGHRVDNLPDDFINTRNEAMLIDSKLVALFIAVPVLIGLFVWVMARGRKKKG